MKINLIPSVYMNNDDDPYMLVPCKLYDQLMKSKAKVEMEFDGLTQTAEGNFEIIYKSFGLDYAKKAPQVEAEQGEDSKEKR